LLLQPFFLLMWRLYLRIVLSRSSSPEARLLSDLSRFFFCALLTDIFQE